MLKSLERAVRPMRDGRLERLVRERRSARRVMLDDLSERDCLILARIADHGVWLDPADAFVSDRAVSTGGVFIKRLEAQFESVRAVPGAKAGVEAFKDLSRVTGQVDVILTGYRGVAA